MISDDTLKRVYKQCANHETLKIKGDILAELLEEIAEYRGFDISYDNRYSKKSHYDFPDCFNSIFGDVFKPK